MFSPKGTVSKFSWMWLLYRKQGGPSEHTLTPVKQNVCVRACICIMLFNIMLFFSNGKFFCLNGIIKSAQCRVTFWKPIINKNRMSENINVKFQGDMHFKSNFFRFLKTRIIMGNSGEGNLSTASAFWKKYFLLITHRKCHSKGKRQENAHSWPEGSESDMSGGRGRLSRGLSTPSHLTRPAAATA